MSVTNQEKSITWQDLKGESYQMEIAKNLLFTQQAHLPLGRKTYLDFCQHYKLDFSFFSLNVIEYLIENIRVADACCEELLQRLTSVQDATIVLGDVSITEFIDRYAVVKFELSEFKQHAGRYFGDVLMNLSECKWVRKEGREYVDFGSSDTAYFKKYNEEHLNPYKIANQVLSGRTPEAFTDLLEHCFQINTMQRNMQH